jgi:imidazolonepropionase
MSAKLIIKNASQLVTCSGFSPKKGAQMADLGVIEDGAVVIEEGSIQAVGPSQEILPVPNSVGFDILDASGKAVLPGFVDSHTHFVFAGYRAEEYNWRLRGDRYMDIMQRGGGILSTVSATRNAKTADLVASGRRRLDAMLAFGVTTVEGKSGYGLDYETEMKQLEVMRTLNREHPVDIVSTFMGAHAVPPDFKGSEERYIDFLIDDVLPEVAKRRLAEFCDVFCEKNVFSIDQSRRLLTKALDFGLKLKLHADEIVEMGGTELAVELGAISADHLLQASDKGMAELARSDTLATLLPGTAFSLREPYARGREMIDRGCAVALASDFNPGSCFTQSIPLIFALATLCMNISTEEAISAFTLNAAAAVDRADNIGSIDYGKQADLIILAYPSYTFIPYHIGMNTVETVIKKGKVVFNRNNHQGGGYVR